MNNTNVSVSYGIGIDVAKGRSMVSILRSDGKAVSKPFSVNHTQGDLETLISRIKSLDGESRVVLECTGRYHEPIAHVLSTSGIFVSAVNPMIIHDFQNEDKPLRHLKTDKADSKKIARYALDRWSSLTPYGTEDETRSQLKTMNRQFSFYSKQTTAMKNNLIALLDMSFPGANKFFESKARDDGSQKWVDFIDTYWHVDCVRNMSLEAFVEHYRKWCKRKKYNFKSENAEEIYAKAKDLVPVLPKDKTTKLFIKQAVEQIKESSKIVERLRNLMDDTASKLPEYPVVMSMTGVGPTFGPQLMAEIGDVTRFTHEGAITAFAGVDPGKNDSGDKSQKSVRTSKRGPSALRRTLFLIMSTLIQNKPQDDPVYQFLDKKRAEGKLYYVYMTAGANKFLRIYYGKVREFLASLQQQPALETTVDS